MAKHYILNARGASCWEVDEFGRIARKSFFNYYEDNYYEDEWMKD